MFIKTVKILMSIIFCGLTCVSTLLAQTSGTVSGHISDATTAASSWRDDHA